MSSLNYVGWAICLTLFMAEIAEGQGDSSQTVQSSEISTLLERVDGITDAHFLPEKKLKSDTISSDTTKGMIIPKIKNNIEFDGHINESAWLEARSLQLIQHQPNFGEKPTEKTEAFIAYTDDYLYVACKCYDSEPPSATSFKRDYFSPDTDYFILILDTFNDNENALAFQTTPTGLRADEAIFNDAAGDPPSDSNWDGFWESEVVETDEGWFAEMRIPFSSLGFEKENDQVVMGVSVSRYIARKNETAVFPHIPPNWGSWSPWKPSQTEDVILEDVEPQTLLHVTPYLLGGAVWQNMLNDSETDYQNHTDPTFDAGLDIKFGLTNNLTLDLTANTDFAQVEVDNQQVNLTRFPLFFPEKRRFFQERSSNFSFNFNSEDRLFYSRRIGLNQEEPVRILGGARIVGRQGPWDIGVLNIQTGQDSNLNATAGGIPSENFGVFRLQRDVVNEDSKIGGIFTSRLAMDGNYDLAYGLDGLFRISGEDYISGKWAQTFQNEMSAIENSLDLARMQLQWERRSYRGIGFDLRFDRAGKQYQPGIGFEIRENYYRFGDRIGYGWTPGEKSTIQQHRINLENEIFFRNEDGSLQSLEFGPEYEILTNSGHSFTFGTFHRVEDLRASFELSEEVEIPADRYDFYTGKISYQMPGSQKLRTSIGINGGEFYDGRRWYAELSPIWNASRYVRLNGFYQWNRLSFPARDQALTAHVGRLRVEITPSVKYSFSSFVQYNSAEGLMVGNLRFRYNPREGNNFYIVYNERLNTNRTTTAGSPSLPLTNNRNILFKYTYTINS